MRQNTSINQHTDLGQRWYHTVFYEDVHLGSNYCRDQGRVWLVSQAVLLPSQKYRFANAE